MKLTDWIRLLPFRKSVNLCRMLSYSDEDIVTIKKISERIPFPMRTIAFMGIKYKGDLEEAEKRLIEAWKDGQSPLSL